MSWSVSREIQPGKYTIDDFNYHTPRDRMTGEGVPETPKDHDLADFEIYDYPGEYDLPGDGTVYARRGSKSCTRGTSSSPAAAMSGSRAPGQVLTLQDHTRSQYNAQYMLTSVSYTASVGEYASGGTAAISIAASRRSRRVRPSARHASRPSRSSRVRRPAIVVGTPGEEIYTDDEGLGRVKVQFHWDRYSQTDENSSCWVASPSRSPGNSWGFLGLPRVGHEVVVEFLEGDPDHPIVTGSVYNDVLKPPYALPTEKTRTGFKSHSSTGGSSSNFNELRFEDKIGEEEIYIHAEKDKTTRVKNDQVKWIGNEDHLIVKQDVFEKREADHHVTLTGDRNEKLEAVRSRSRSASGDLLGKVANKLAYDVGTEIHLKSGNTIVLESSTKITLKWSAQQLHAKSRSTPRRSRSRARHDRDRCRMTKVNSGVSAGSAARLRSTPNAPEAPSEAGESVGGDMQAPPTKVPPKRLQPAGADVPDGGAERHAVLPDLPLPDA